MQGRMISRARLIEILNAIHTVRVAFVGDVCVDAYWFADMRKSTLSRETPHFNLPVVSERYSLGAGGNVLNNLSALGPAKIIPITVLSRDWRGVIARDLMEQLRYVDMSMVVQDEARLTPAYCKPHKSGYAGVPVEEARIDFENSEPLSDDTAQALLNAFHMIADNVDGIAVCDQFAMGAITKPLREAICKNGAKGRLTIADSRDRIALYRNVILKPNEIEAARALNVDVREATPENYIPIARQLARDSGTGAVVTLGGQGALCAEGNGDVTHVPACTLQPPFDIVGAGDAFLAALLACMAAGATMWEAASVGALASGVTVKKLGQTGTATPEEILDLYNRLSKQ